jgi:hypothetical protein
MGGQSLRPKRLIKAYLEVYDDVQIREMYAV